jgi:hypothetical protein
MLPVRTLTPIDERLTRRRRILPASGCWLWQGTTTNAGYGSMTIRTEDGPKSRLVHRVAYEHYLGPIPAGHTLDHLCRVRLCFNPDHLEPVTPQVNVLRSPIAPAAVNARKTHCPQGHPYDEANTIQQRRGGRLCRTCQSTRARGAVS